MKIFLKCLAAILLSQTLTSCLSNYEELNKRIDFIEETVIKSFQQSISILESNYSSINLMLDELTCLNKQQKNEIESKLKELQLSIDSNKNKIEKIQSGHYDECEINDLIRSIEFEIDEIKKELQLVSDVLNKIMQTLNEENGLIKESTCLNDKIVVGGCYNLGGNKIGDVYTSTPTNVSSGAYLRIAIEKNSTYEVKGIGSKYSYRFYAFLDKNLKILELASDEYNTRDNSLILTPPAEAVLLIVNFTNYDSTQDYVTKTTTLQVADLVDMIKPLNGIKMVCFGDSITQFKDKIGMSYSDYLERYGAEVANVGIGGTQIRQRTTPSVKPTSFEQAYGGLDIVSLVNAVASNDYAIVEASASYVQKYYTPQYNPKDVIERLKSIDWSEVDIVTILGGTNDWNIGGNLGENTDVEPTSTLGALNLIIKSLLSAHPHIKIYCFTPIVRYVANSPAERTDATWAGTTTNNEGKTLLDYVDAIKDVAENNCIPVCDMYRTMGWNKYNFSWYFNDNDGTHPYKGYEEIAKRMQAFICEYQ